MLVGFRPTLILLPRPETDQHGNTKHARSTATIQFSLNRTGTLTLKLQAASDQCAQNNPSHRISRTQPEHQYPTLGSRSTNSGVDACCFSQTSNFGSLRPSKASAPHVCQKMATGRPEFGGCPNNLFPVPCLVADMTVFRRKSDVVGNFAISQKG